MEDDQVAVAEDSLELAEAVICLYSDQSVIAELL
jgi:hypothetical protein